MIVTETKLRDLVGYTPNQVRRRRELFWDSRHYWKEPGGAMVYSLEEIKRWQGSQKAEESVVLDGSKTERYTVKPSKFRTQLLE